MNKSTNVPKVHDEFGYLVMPNSVMGGASHHNTTLMPSPGKKGRQA